MSHAKHIRKGQSMQQFFSETASHWSRVSGFVQRVSKVTGPLFAQVMVLCCLDNPEATLGAMVQMSAQLGVEISESGWHQRLTDAAVAMLGALLGQAVQRASGVALPARVLQRFSSIQLLDSTAMNLPPTLRAQLTGTKQQVALKLQVSFDYLRGVFRALLLTEARTPDQTCRLHVEQAEPGSLHLFDLGYFKQDVLAHLAALGAFFISRLQTQTALYAQSDDPDRLDLVAFLQSRPADRWEGWLYLGRKTRLAVRLLAEPVPAPVADQRRRKARQKARRRGQTCSARHLTLLGWSLFITNVPADWLPFDQVLLLYRVRWQVELLFKLCKSQAKLASAGEWGLPRFLCQFYARLIGVVLFHGLAAPLRLPTSRELSLPKAFTLFQRSATALAHALPRPRQLVALLTQLERDFLRFALKTQRKKSPSTYQSLVLSGGLA